MNVINFIYCRKSVSKANSRWLGLSRQCSVTNSKDPLNFVWIDGTTGYNFNDTYWGSNQPDNYMDSGLSSQQACSIMNGRNNLKWYDVSCDQMYNFVCQYKISGHCMILFIFTFIFCRCFTKFSASTFLNATFYSCVVDNTGLH